MPETTHPSQTLTNAPACSPGRPGTSLHPAASVSSGQLVTRGRRACQRGMVTAEYAVGILAAIALALVLVKVFNNNAFFTTMLAQVTQLIGQIGKSIK